MARYVKVSALSVTACEAKAKPQNMDMVDYVIQHLERNLQRVLCDQPDIIVLPEVCDRPAALGKAERLAYYRERGDKVQQYLQRVARENRCYIAYPSHSFYSEDAMVNCCRMIDRQGNVIGQYDKNFPTIQECLDNGVKSGAEATIFDCDFGRVGAAICFDLNFDEYRAKLKAAKPDLIVFCSNFHGGILQNYFAYDTQSYLACAIGFARIPGGIISPVGERIAETTTYYNFVTEIINLDYAVCHLDCNMAKIQAAREKYGSKIKLCDPGHLGAVLLTSETDEFTIQDVINEFDIELLDSYLERSKTYAQSPENMRRG
jgi:predicted amidohydrolase